MMALHREISGSRSGFVLGTLTITTLVIGLILNVDDVSSASASVFDKGIPPDKSTRDKSGAIIDATRGRGSGNSNANINNNNANLFENNNHNNELHSTNFNFHDISGGEILVDEDDARESDDDGNYYDYDAEDSEFSEENKDYSGNIQHENEHDLTPVGKPKIGKCCPYGEGLNANGLCKPIKTVHLLHHEKQWFPDKVYDGIKMMSTNISEWEIIANHRIDCGVNQSTEIVSDMKRFAILQDGRMYLAYSSHNAKFIPALEFCVDQELGKGEGRVIRSCFSKQDMCGDEKCLRKCCPEGAVVEQLTSKCSTAHVTYNDQNQHHLRNDNWTVIHATPSCQKGQHLYNIQMGFNISDDGNLVTGEINAPFLHYCIDHFLNGEHSNRSLQLKALVCFEYDNEVVTSDQHHSDGLPRGVKIVYGLCFIVSAMCLAFAAAISWRLPELRSLHGKCQLSHLGTLFCLFIFLGTVHLGTNEMPDGLCTFLAVMIHICGLSSFMWLNLLCVNIYLTFRSLRPPLAARRDENRRLFFLCVYAWGIPAAFCIFLYILDSTPGRLDPMPQPMYGVTRCLMSSRAAEFAYFFGPVGVLLLCNGLLFCLTAQELLCGLWRLDNAESLTFRRKSMGIVVAKLGIVMGMGWILDVLSWVVGSDFPYMFHVSDFFNALQGVFICLVLIWRKRVLEVLHIRKPSLTKDETLTARPFLPKNSINNSTLMQGDHDTSLVIVQES